MNMKEHCSDPHENLAWLDLETTGLRPDEDAILEIGVVITDRELNTVNQLALVTQPSRNVPITEIDPYVAEMHSKSGLWLECLGAKGAFTFEHACSLARDFIFENKAAGSPMCGSTISFDRGFLKAQSPLLNGAFHYRNIDVSTLKNVMRLHFPAAPQWSPMTGPKHRALDDLHNSICEYGHYLQWMRTGQ
jgi:oligoribonuclease